MQFPPWLVEVTIAIIVLVPSLLVSRAMREKWSGFLVPCIFLSLAIFVASSYFLTWIQPRVMAVTTKGEIAAKFPQAVVLLRSDPRLQGTELVDYSLSSKQDSIFVGFDPATSQQLFIIGAVWWGGRPEAALPVYLAAKRQNMAPGPFMQAIVTDHLWRTGLPQQPWLKANRGAYVRKYRALFTDVPSGVEPALSLPYRTLGGE